VRPWAIVRNEEMITARLSVKSAFAGRPRPSVRRDPVAELRIRAHKGPPRIGWDLIIVAPAAVDHKAHSIPLSRSEYPSSIKISGLEKAYGVLAILIPAWQATIRLSMRSVAMIFVVIFLLAPATFLLAADQTEEIQQEQTRARQQEQVNQANRREQLEQFKRDQQLNQAQQHLDQVKQQTVNQPLLQPQQQQQQQQQINQTQQRLDQLKNEQQINRVQTELEINRIQREQNLPKQDIQLRQLQMEQQINQLQDQQRKFQIQQDLNRIPKP
jgi:hypothetical protein